MTFDSTAGENYRTVSIGEAIVAGTVTVDGAAYTWAFSDEGGSVTADSLTLSNNASLTITGNGTFTFGGTNNVEALYGSGTIEIVGGATLKLLEGTDQVYDDTDVTIKVSEGGTLDVNGSGDTTFKLVLNGGTLTSSADDPTTRIQLPTISLTADSTVNATHSFGMLASSYGETTLDLAGHTLAKTGDGNFYLYHTTVSAGTIDVQAGTLTLYGADASAATITVETGATLSVGSSNNNYDSKVGTLNSSGTVDLKAGSTLEITGNSVISGALSIETSDGNSSTLKVTNGANLTLNVSSALVGSGSSLSIGENSSLTLNTSLAFHDSNGNVSGDVTFSESASLIVNQSVFNNGVTVDETTQTAAVAVITANTISFGDTILSSGFDYGDVTDLVSSYITVQSGEYHVTGWYYYADNGTLYAIFAVPEPSMFGVLLGISALGLTATRRRRRRQYREAA